MGRLQEGESLPGCNSRPSRPIRRPRGISSTIIPGSCTANTTSPTGPGSCRSFPTPGSPPATTSTRSGAPANLPGRQSASSRPSRSWPCPTRCRSRPRPSRPPCCGRASGCPPGPSSLPRPLFDLNSHAEREEPPGRPGGLPPVAPGRRGRRAGHQSAERRRQSAGIRRTRGRGPGTARHRADHRDAASGEEIYAPWRRPATSLRLAAPRRGLRPGGRRMHAPRQAGHLHRLVGHGRIRHGRERLPGAGAARHPGPQLRALYRTRAGLGRSPTWAERHARWMRRHCFADRALGARLGEAARVTILERFFPGYRHRTAATAGGLEAIAGW